METQANFALIGALVLASVVAFASFVLWFGQSQFNQEFDTYEIVFTGPVTLESGAAVRFNGINVGEVTRVAIDRNDDSLVRTRIRINSTTPVRTDSVAVIDFAGITGLTFVQIRAGSEGAPLLERGAGEPIPVIRSEMNPLAELFASGAQILERTNEGFDRVGAVLSDENVAAFSHTLENLDTFSGTLAENDALSSELSATLESIRKASDAFADASTATRQLVRDADQTLLSLTDDADAILTETRGAIDDARSLMARTEAAIGHADDAIDGPGRQALEEVRLAGQEMRILIQRLDGVVRDLEQNPQIVVTGDPKPYEGGRR